MDTAQAFKVEGEQRRIKKNVISHYTPPHEDFDKYKTQLWHFYSDDKEQMCRQRIAQLMQLADEINRKV